MSTQKIRQTDYRYRFGYWVLIILSSSTAINSVIRVFLESTPEFVVGWVAASVTYVITLLIPFRNGERWAWYTTWVFAALLASVFLVGAEVGIYYLSASIVVALCLLLTRPSFFEN